MANPTKTDKPLRAAIIGAGDWAQQYHFPALALLANERAVDISPAYGTEPLQRPRRLHGSFQSNVFIAAWTRC